MLFFRNSSNEWIKVRAYEGTGLHPFVTEEIAIASVPSGNGTFFFSQFQARFVSRGTASATEIFDDWFVDNVSLSGPTSVQGGSPGSVPTRFALGQNYPNPFNPTTSISFDLPHDSRVRLDVYNLLGERVRTLIDENVGAGTHQVVWDGTDERANAVVSGVYFYRLEAPGFASVRKMLLLK
jgi:hypothetical protein